MKISKTDRKIMEMEGERQKDDAYKSYILDRFSVEDIHEGRNGMCATIHDKESDESKDFHEGDTLADGKIQMVDNDGIVFKPPKAKQPPFALRSKKELLPVKGDTPVMIISVVKDSEAY